MGRKRGGLLEDFMGLGAKFPWYISVIVALAVFLLLTWVSDDFLVQSSAVKPTELGGFFVHRLFISIAWFLRWVIPAALLIGAAVSAIRGRKKQTPR